jgi:hypothetical protein
MQASGDYPSSNSKVPATRPQLRATWSTRVESGRLQPTPAEYSMPVFGLIFLRHADNCFEAHLPRGPQRSSSNSGHVSLTPVLFVI